MGPTASLSPNLLMRASVPIDEANPVWVINYAAKAFQHTHAWNTHDLVKIGEKEPEKNFIPFYEKHDRPLVTLMEIPEVPAYLYPLAQVAEYWQDDYFFTAPPYMLAYAGWCGVKKVRLFGLDYDYPNRTDYEAGRACTEYWIGRLRSFGVTFEVPEQSSLLDFYWRDKGGRMKGYGAPFYGFFDYQPDVQWQDDGSFKLEHNPFRS